MVNSTFVTKRLFYFATSVVVDLFELCRDTTLLLEKALDVTDFSFRLTLLLASTDA